MNAGASINKIEIEDTFAEAFDMVYSRILVTAENEHWLNAACQAATGFATSVIGCGVEAGVEAFTDDTPDGRPGACLLFFTMGKKGLEKHLIGRIGQALMTCPTTAVFNALDSDSRFDTGSSLRYFGDGLQSSKVIGERRYWRIPVMEGEFVVEESFGWAKGIGGGNFLILAGSQDSALEASRKAVEAIDPEPGVILPFPGGVVRSGSKIGSRYKFLNASTNTAYCPTIRRQTDSALNADVNCVLEIVIDGVDEAAIKNAMKKGIASACKIDGVLTISAGNYGGKLGSFHFYLHQIV